MRKKLNSLILVSVLLFCGTSHGAVSFVQPRSLPLTFTSDGAVGSLARADFDNNGSPDIAVAYSAGGAGYVGVLLAGGSGNFAAPIAMPLPTGTYNTLPNSVLARDFDGDGVADLIVAASNYHGSNNILFYKGRGDGTFNSPVSAALSGAANGAPYGLQSEDLNGDSLPDIVSLNISENRIAVLSGNGDGTFSAPQYYATGANPTDIAITDLNNDSLPDVVTSSYDDHTLSVFINDGLGGFTSSQYPARIQVTGMQVGDFNKDGSKDLVITGYLGPGCYTNCLALMPGKGDGTFDPIPDAAFSQVIDYLGSNNSQKVIQDINADGNADIVMPVANGSNEVLVGLGGGDGSFTFSVYAAAAATTGSNSSNVDGGNPTSVLIHDFDGDGTPDMVVGESSTNGRNGSLSYLPGTTAGRFVSPRLFHLGRGLSSTTKSVVAGDFDSDGIADALLLTSVLDFMKGNGDGTFASSTAALGTVGSEGYNTLRTADFDKDGRLDAIWLGVNGVQGGNAPRNLVAFGNGDGTFGNLLVFSNTASGAGGNVIISDLDNDTYPDLVIWANGGLEIFLNNHDRTFSSAPGSPLGLGALPLYPGKGIAAGDFNKDGKIDLITHLTISFPDGSSPERLIFFAGNGDGTFQAPATITGLGLPDISDFHSADLNNDTNPDLIGYGGGGAYVLLGNGDGTFAAPVYYGAGTYATQMRLADFDGDGNNDIAAVTGQSVVVFPGNADGTFDPAIRLAVGNTNNYSLDVADLNSDGRIDIVTAQNSGSRYTITALINDSGQRADIRVSVSRSPASTDVGQPVTFAVTVTNDGPDAAAGVTLKLTVPLNGMISSITTERGSCTGTNNISCDIGALAAGASVNITIVVVPTLAGIPLWLTAEGHSTTLEPRFLDNGASASSSIGAQWLRLYSPRRLMVGDTVDYVIRYANISGLTLDDVVVVLDLPPLKFKQSKDGIFHKGHNQVFWRLGSLPAGVSGDLTVSVEVPWGIAGHTPYHVSAWIGWSGPLPSPKDISEYLTYSTKTVSSTTSLGPAAVAALLAGSADVQALYDQAVAQGYRDYGVGTMHTFSDGSEERRILMINPSTKQVAAVLATASGSSLEYVNAERYAIGGTGGSVGFNFSSFSTEYEGDWAKIHSPSFGECMWGCILPKIPIWLLSKYGGDAVSKVIGGAKCSGCSDQNPSDCTDCLGLIRELPFVGEGIDVVQCNEDCRRCVGQVPGANCYRCTQDNVYCTKASWVEHYIGGQDVVIYINRCTPQGIWAYVTERQFCTMCAHGQVCRNGQCSCCEPQNGESCDTGEVVTAHDPNRLSGPSGDVVRGQTLTYTIEYENEGAGTAYGVFVTGSVSANLDETTLVIGNGGVYHPATRTIFWETGDIVPGEGGSVSFSAAVRSSAPIDSEIIATAGVHFPSVPEITPTNGVVAVVRPVSAASQTVDAISGTPVGITLTGSDPAGLPLAFSVSSLPAHGALSGAAPSVTYTSSPGFSGVDTFTFRVHNGTTESEPATVTVRVSPSPGDATPPQVTSVSPAGGTSIAVSTRRLSETSYYPMIKAYFSEPLDPNTVDSTSFVITAGGSPVGGSVFFDASDNSVVFTPAAPLSYATVYTVTANTGIRDLAGNGLASPYSWSFETFGASALNASPKSSDFGSIGTHTERVLAITLHNSGGDYLSITSVSIGGPDGPMFSIGSDTCSSSVIVPGGSCVVNVRFFPSTTGPKSATLDVTGSSGAISPALIGSATLSQWSIDVTRSGSGNGIVVSNPAGINCGSGCSASYDDGITVELTATPDPGTEFAGWSGNCSGNASPCSLLIDGPKTVDAVFNFIADFSAAPLSGGAPLVVSFTDLSAGNPVAWSWAFGDGAAGTAQDPVHLFEAPGSYSVSLVASGSGGIYGTTKYSYITVTACGRKARSGSGGSFGFYDSIQSAYDSSSSGDDVDALGIEITEDLNLNQDKTVTLRGGWDCAFTTNALSRTTLHGSLTIGLGTAIPDGLILQ